MVALKDAPLTDAELAEMEFWASLDRDSNAISPPALNTLRLVTEVRRLRAALARIADDDTAVYGSTGDFLGHTTMRRIASAALHPERGEPTILDQG